MVGGLFLRSENKLFKVRTAFITTSRDTFEAGANPDKKEVDSWL